MALVQFLGEWITQTVSVPVGGLLFLVSLLLLPTREVADMVTMRVGGSGK